MGQVPHHLWRHWVVLLQSLLGNLNQKFLDKKDFLGTTEMPKSCWSILLRTITDQRPVEENRSATLGISKVPKKSILSTPEQHDWHASRIVKNGCNFSCDSSNIMFCWKRAFSELWRLKAYLYSTIKQARLSNLALLNIEGRYANEVLKSDMTQMIDSFAKKKNRDCFFIPFFCFLFDWQLNKSLNTGMLMWWVITSDFKILNCLFAIYL